MLSLKQKEVMDIFRFHDFFYCLLLRKDILHQGPRLIVKVHIVEAEENLKDCGTLWIFTIFHIIDFLQPVSECVFMDIETGSGAVQIAAFHEPGPQGEEEGGMVFPVIIHDL